MNLSEALKNIPQSKYDRQIHKFFKPKSLSLAQDIKVGKEVYGQYGKIKTFETKGGLMFQYIDGEDAVYIVGMISPRQKMGRDDYNDFMEIVDLMVSKLKKGKTIVTTPNEISMKIIKHLERTAKKKYDLKVKIKKLGKEKYGSDPHLKFTHLEISI